MALDTSKNQNLAELLFPNITQTISDLEKKFPPRNLTAEAEVTRFAPSPTGFVHIGGIYASLISRTLAKQTKGVFYLRIEDTDKKREVADGVQGIIDSLNNYKLSPDEGAISETKVIGDYGPYKQSERKDIYHVFAKYLVSEGKAYPCFCSSEKLEEQSKTQMAQKIRPGYYGEWATHREASFEEVQKLIAAAEPYVLRLRSEAKDEKIILTDVIRGTIEMPANDQDSVLLKSDGIPTYHFAHIVDDFLMRTTTVIRGDEWLSSVPLHLELFSFINVTHPKYGHIAPIMKMDGTSRRKLSKRKDPEAAVSFYSELGFPPEAVAEYLMNLANSSFEDWRKANPNEPISNFNFVVSKMNKSGALFDMNKLNNISREVISKLSLEEKYAELVAWAEKNNKNLHTIITTQQDRTKAALNVEADSKKRKDLTSWYEFLPTNDYFYEELFAIKPLTKEMFPTKTLEDGKEFLKQISTSYQDFKDKETWHEFMCTLAEKLGYATDFKEFKANPSNYKGNLGDLLMFLRICLTKSDKSPDLFEVCTILGKDVVINRVEQGLAIFA